MVTVLFNAPVCFECRDRYGVSTFRSVTVSACSICARARTACYIADKDQEIDWTQYHVDGMENVEFTRASGDALCRGCGRPYRDHPNDRRPEALNWQGDPFLRVLCDGRRVKL